MTWIPNHISTHTNQYKGWWVTIEWANHVTVNSSMLYYHCLMNIYQALQQMRALSAENIPFSISFVSYNETKQYSNGVRIVDKCLLRTGLSKANSDKSDTIISYVDLEDDSNKSFNLPLLLTFNQIEIE